MREPHSASNLVPNSNEPAKPQQPLNQLSIHQLQEMAHRQQQQIESQQHMLVAKEQRLKYLRQQDMRQQQMTSEYERLRRLREKVENRELKLRKLRALRGHQQGAYINSNNNNGMNANAVVLADLESIRALFTEKEKELTNAVRKVEDLTHQLEDLRSGRINNSYPPQVVELERLRRELAYRKQLNEQQNNMIAQQRAQLSMGKDEMMKIDNRIMELQDRLARKRMMNQQLATQITAATSAKQAQLRAIQQGMNKNNKTNKPVSTVEPFQRQISTEQALQDDFNNKVNKNQESDLNKYQTLPFGTKFGGQKQLQKIEQLRQQEKENNNVQFSEDLQHQQQQSRYNNTNNGRQGAVDNQNLNQASATLPDNYGSQKPVSSVAPVPTTSTTSTSASMASNSSSNNVGSRNLERPTDLFPDNFVPNHMAPQNEMRGSPDSPSKPKPALPPKPLVSASNSNSNNNKPPPYIPAPPPDNSNSRQPLHLLESMDDSSITIRDSGQGYSASNVNNLSVSAHPEEGTSVDDDMPSPPNSNDGDDDNGGNGNRNVHVSINRRIEMPPAFHFPEDQTPPSDLIGRDHFSRDVADNAQMYPMMNQIYQEFDHLSTEEKQQLFSKTMEEEEYPTTVPDFDSDHDDSVKPPGIVKRTNLKGLENSTSHNKHVCFDPLALLLDASLEGELDLVQKTAGMVQDPSAANDEGITALHNSICAGHFDIVKFLVEFGCDVNAQDSDGWTPLHCAASCNNLPMVRFLVEHGACIFATTFSDHETAAEKCEEDEEGFAGCSEYLYSIQDKLGVINNGKVYALYDHIKGQPDELSFESEDVLIVVKKGDEVEKDWWWSRKEDGSAEGYIPRNFLGLCPRVLPDDHDQEEQHNVERRGEAGKESSEEKEKNDENSESSA